MAYRLVRHGESERPCRDAVRLDARRVAVSAAIAAVQREADRSRTFPRQDFIVAHPLLEHGARVAAGKRHEDVEFAPAAAAKNRLAILALGVAQIENVIVAAVAGEIECAHGVGREGYVAAARGPACIAGVLQHALDALRPAARIERFCYVLGDSVAAANDGGDEKRSKPGVLHVALASAVAFLGAPAHSLTPVRT